jgi:hypothetical protein
MASRWYVPTNGTCTVYTLGRGVQVKDKYPLGRTYLGAPRLDYDADDRVYRLADAARQVEALDDARLASHDTSRDARARWVYAHAACITRIRSAV